MSFFGEVLFLLSGLKACVLLSNLPPTWRQSFASDVVVASGLVHNAAPATGTLSPCSVALSSVGTRLETPAGYELSGDLVLVNTVHADFAVAQRTLRLADVTLDANGGVQLVNTDTSVSGLVQEHELARVLDYPVALSECNEDAPMIEVSTLAGSRCQSLVGSHDCELVRRRSGTSWRKGSSACC
ncbi:unnamed protein product [Phytophthora fragariaefolia]|uniref:Unnamed protein product n=1 Tax=Phytophthora fragariaefolia TaxID=1490495 RepID=A0A9W6XHT0_9STRA|nr:unnamed protein product [Phytophthora fragariaefolia]